MSALRIETEAGAITLRLRPDAAPETCKYILQCVASKLYDGRSFYRSDFVIQFGLHGSGVQNPHGDLSVNETHAHVKLSNRRGTCSVAHWDVPDCGNTECFINLGENAHLDAAYGGYCVFAEVDAADAVSFATVDKIAAQVKGGEHARIVSVQAVD
jgi:cyclophilin family peptidyl-prolyl cis-trans isomerase